MGEVGNESSDQTGLAQAGAVPALDDGEGGGGADAGGAEGEGGVEGALGLGAILEGQAVAPGRLGAEGLDDGVEGFLAAGQGHAVDAVAAGRGQGLGSLLDPVPELIKGLGETGRVAPGGGLETDGAARLPDGAGHGAGGGAGLGRLYWIQSSSSLAYLTKTPKAERTAMMKPWRPSSRPALRM